MCLIRPAFELEIGLLKAHELTCQSVRSLIDRSLAYYHNIVSRPFRKEPTPL